MLSTPEMMLLTTLCSLRFKSSNSLFVVIDLCRLLIELAAYCVHNFIEFIIDLRKPIINLCKFIIYLRESFINLCEFIVKSSLLGTQK